MASILRMIVCASVVSALPLPSPALGAGTEVQFRENTNVLRWARGTYEYTQGKTGKWRGEDQWTLTVNKDASRTMRIFSLVQETGVMRDVIHRVDKDFRPIETYVSTFKDGVRTGSGLFVFHGNAAKGFVNADNGILTQDLTVPDFFAMVPHSMAADGWYFGKYDRAKGGVQTVSIFNPHAWGNTNGSILGKVQTVPIRLVGNEQITVPAGVFATEAWEITNGSDKYSVWVYGPDRIMIRLIDHSRDWVYSLSSLDEPK